MAGNTDAIIFNQIARFGVPVFIFLSGWGITVADSYKRSEGYWDFLKTRLGKLVSAYLVWNVVYLLYGVIASGEMIEIGAAFVGVFLGTNAPHLYFVPLIVVFYMLYPWLLKVGQSYIGVVVSLLVTIYSLLATWGITIEGFTRNHNVLNWVFYFVFGIWVAENQDWLKEKVNKYLAGGLLVASLALVILEPTELTEEILLTQTRPSVIFYSVMVIVLFAIMNAEKFPLQKGLVELSEHSYYIYLSHYLFVYLYRDVFPDLNLIVVSLSVLLLSYGLAKTADRVFK